MLARARAGTRAAKILAIFVKSVKTLKSHATAKILKMVKSTLAFGRGQNFSKVVKIFAPPKSYPVPHAQLACVSAVMLVSRAG